MRLIQQANELRSIAEPDSAHMMNVRRACVTHLPELKGDDVTEESAQHDLPTGNGYVQACMLADGIFGRIPPALRITT